MNIHFCASCGSAMERRVPEDDDRIRSVCTRCGFVHYRNPIMVVGCIPEWEGSILMCRRNIEPCRGKWTLPAGYLENGETVQDGAARETREETLADVEILGPFRMFTIVHVNQIYLMFRAKLRQPVFGPTPESTEVRLFSPEAIPWGSLAFPVIRETLRHYIACSAEQDPCFSIVDLERESLNR